MRTIAQQQQQSNTTTLFPHHETPSYTPLRKFELDSLEAHYGFNNTITSPRHVNNNDRGTTDKGHTTVRIYHPKESTNRHPEKHHHHHHEDVTKKKVGVVVINGKIAAVDKRPEATAVTGTNANTKKHGTATDKVAAVENTTKRSYHPNSHIQHGVGSLPVNNQHKGQSFTEDAINLLKGKDDFDEDEEEDDDNSDKYYYNGEKNNTNNSTLPKVVKNIQDSSKVFTRALTNEATETNVTTLIEQDLLQIQRSGITTTSSSSATYQHDNYNNSLKNKLLLKKQKKNKKEETTSSSDLLDVFVNSMDDLADGAYHQVNKVAISAADGHITRDTSRVCDDCITIIANELDYALTGITAIWGACVPFWTSKLYICGCLDCNTKSSSTKANDQNDDKNKQYYYEGEKHYRVQKQ